MADDSRPQRLTGKQQAFVDAYLGEARFNATRAALIAGYAESGASVIGFENLRNTKIREVIDTELTNRAMVKEAVLSEISDIATDHAADLGDRLRALELMGKAYALFTDKQQTQVTADGPIPLVVVKAGN